MDTTELKILQKYASGGELQAIADGLDISKEQVADVVDKVVGFSRQRASALLREHDAKTRKPVAVTFAPPADAEPPADPAAPPAVAAKSPPAAGGVGGILGRAEQAGGKYATRAARIRAAVVELGRDLDAAAEVLEAERQVEQLRAQLADAAAKLRSLKTPGTPAAASSSTLSRTAEVRAWAAEHSIPCPAMGRVPKAVMEAYEGRAA